ncbi:MAG: hypothetical protein M3N42_03835 [Cyanobacteriota bacterium]|nr:hypothetical protein [Cyanobacteriota bacterium]
MEELNSTSKSWRTLWVGLGVNWKCAGYTHVSAFYNQTIVKPIKSKWKRKVGQPREYLSVVDTWINSVAGLRVICSKDGRFKDNQIFRVVIVQIVKIHKYIICLDVSCSEKVIQVRKLETCHKLIVALRRADRAVELLEKLTRQQVKCVLK